MPISVFEPIHQGLSLREAMNRLLEDSFVKNGVNPSSSGQMPIDVVETQNAYIVYAALPGASKDAVQIHYEKDLLTIKAELQAPPLPEQGRSLHKERFFGSLSRTFRLPMAVDAEQASAEFEQGVLILTLPKLESVRPRQIPIR